MTQRYPQPLKLPADVGGVTYRYCWSVGEKMGQTYVHHETANTLAARDYKQPQAVILIRDGRTDID